MFCDADDDDAVEVVVPPVPSLVPVWQWCNQPEPSRDPDHWQCFPPQVEDMLREAWDQNDVDEGPNQRQIEFELKFMSGVSVPGVKSTISVNRMKMFHEMTELGRQRWVRRIFMEPDTAENHRKKLLLSSVPKPYNNECPICMEGFTEGTNSTVTLHCEHAFHLQCLQQMEDQMDKSECPLCRRDF